MDRHTKPSMDFGGCIHFHKTVVSLSRGVGTPCAPAVTLPYPREKCCHLWGSSPPLQRKRPVGGTCETPVLSVDTLRPSPWRRLFLQALEPFCPLKMMPSLQGCVEFLKFKSLKAARCLFTSSVEGAPRYNSASTENGRSHISRSSPLP